MADYKDHKVVRELADLTYTMWNMGWDEKKWREHQLYPV